MLLAVLALALAASPAQASVADQFVPVRDASDGVRFTGSAFRFGPKSAKLYRSIAGRKATTVCASVERSGNGWHADSLGFTGPHKLPRKRGPVNTGTGGKLDICAIGTEMNIDDHTCLALARVDEGPCARVIVVRTADGRRYIDWISRTFELGMASQLDVEYPPEWAQGLELMHGAFGPDVVGLASPDATPPAGKVGFYKQDGVTVVAAQLMDGRRTFIRREGDVISTNLPHTIPAGDGTLSLFPV